MTDCVHIVYINYIRVCIYTGIYIISLIARSVMERVLSDPVSKVACNPDKEPLSVQETHDTVYMSQVSI